jgi:hypothetical protein
MHGRNSVSPLHRVFDAKRIGLRLVQHRLVRPWDFGAVSVMPCSIKPRIDVLRFMFAVRRPGDGTLGMGAAARVDPGLC